MVNRDVKSRGGQLFMRGLVDAVLLDSYVSSFVTGIVLFADGGILQL
jgi:hypothetical protein